MSKVRCWVLCVTVSLLVGCSDNPTGVFTHLQSPGSPAFDRGQGDRNMFVASVDGHAAFEIPGLPGFFDEYSVNAKRRAGGSVVGELELRQQRYDGEYHIHGTMLCVTATGSTARLAARVDRSDHPDVHPGQYLAWTVTDNDANDHDRRPDLSTQFFLYDQTVAQFHCDVGLNIGPQTPIRGHIEVRDATTEEGHNNR